jgi:histidinol-phosphate aminotransferase
MEPRDLSAHAEYRAGRGIEEVAREHGLDSDDLVKLASNENMHGPSPHAIEVIRDNATRMHTYPKSSHSDLAEALAAHWDVTPAQVWLGNGGDGVLDYFARAMLEPGDGVLVPEPGFAYYPMSARFHHGEVNTYQLSRSEEFAMDPAHINRVHTDERIIYITSPHNPTGAEMAREKIASLADRTPQETLIVVDEAYAEYSDRPGVRPLLDDRSDIAILRTFSKVYGLAGVRIGYGLVPESWADTYARVNTPFAASELACLAGQAALNDADHVQASVETAQWAREYYHDTLDVPTWPSGGNFVLCEVGDATAVSNSLERNGVIVRDCSSFGLPDCIRVTAGTRPETKRAVAQINKVVDK